MEKEQQVRIAIVDVLGLPYDGTTVFKRGLGGSESAVIFLSQQLVKLGMSVTVFNHCDVDDCKPGIYEGVEYVSLKHIAQHRCDFDFAISSRSVEPWVPSDMTAQVQLKMDHSTFDRLRQNAKHKILWLHDTFCYGDHILEDLVTRHHINELFVLSDWHMTYVLNCDHGRKRNFEVLKNRTWITRNGVNTWIDWVDIASKDPNQFVYNSSVSKGMEPLLTRIWPRIRKEIPDATLKIIGGYYKFQEDQPPDEQEQRWHDLRLRYHNKDGVCFLGIIPQQQIAHVLAHSTFMLYPAAFPETFGISAVESLLYNTPLITCRFGALEETALDMACYKVDYAIEPNGLFPLINSDSQVDEFVNLTVWAHKNKYLLQQKQNYCSVIKPVVGWDTVALQWKQHFYRLKDQPLAVEEFAEVSLRQQRLNRLFNRRTVNMEHLQIYSKPEQPIVVVTPFFNCEDYISRCIISVATQNYHNYTHVLIDDASTDRSAELAAQTIASCPPHIREKFFVLQNNSNQGAVFNHHQALQWCRSRGVSEDAIIMLLDGDDWLVNQNDVFSQFNLHFEPHVQFSYGSCWSVADSIPLIAQEYPPAVRANRGYRQHQFNWIVPYTHMRAFRFGLFDQVDVDLWKDSKGDWFTAGGDTAVFYSLLECAEPHAVKVMQDVLVNYNDSNPLNDYKTKNEQQLATAHQVLLQKPSQDQRNPVIDIEETLPSAHNQPSPSLREETGSVKRILIGVPTAKYIEVETFKSIYDLTAPPNTQLEFQYFWGYNVEQVRNIMVSYTLRNQFDYLFSVDSDIVLQQDTLVKLLACQDHLTGISSGVYIQRKDDVRIPEIYVTDPATGGHRNLHIEEVQEDRVIKVDGVGFGCCLVRADVFEKVGNPWFVYHSNIDFTQILSEDVDFCIKAQKNGFAIAVDTSIKLDHIHKQYLNPRNPK